MASIRKDNTINFVLDIGTVRFNRKEVFLGSKSKMMQGKASRLDQNSLRGGGSRRT
jgi:hypothetical protein